MSRRRPVAKLPAARWLRPAVTIFLAAVVCLIAGLLLVRIVLTPRKGTEPTDILDGKIDVKKNVQVSHYKRDRGRIDIKGDRNVPAGPNAYRLEGHVEVVRKRPKGDDIRMTAESILYDKEMTRFKLEGGVRVKYKTLTMGSPAFDYDRVDEILKTEIGGTIASESFEGSSRKLAFHPKDDVAVLEDGLILTLRTRLSPDKPVVLGGDKLTYDFRSRRGDVDGRPVDIRHGQSTGRSGHAYLEQFERTDDVRLIELRDGVTLALQGEVQPPPKAAKAETKSGAGATESAIGRDLSLAESVRQDVVADAVRLRAFENLPLLESAVFRGRASVTFLYASGNVTDIRGESVNLSFRKDGVLRLLSASGGGRMESRDKAGAIFREIEAQTLTLDNERGLLAATGRDKAKARFVSGGTDVSGETVTITVKTEDFEAQGGVSLRFLAAQPEAGKPGFFIRDRPVFATARTLRYSSRLRRFSLRDDVDRGRCWQESGGQTAKTLTAKEIAIAEDTGDFAGTGSVQTVFPHRPKPGEPERRIEVAADAMRFDPQSGQVVYEGRCVLKTGTAVLKSGRITVEPADDGGVRIMRAVKDGEGAVSVAMDVRTATGEIAEYDVAKDTITITGQPVLRDKDKNEVRGVKLTFYLADGKIQVQ